MGAALQLLAQLGMSDHAQGLVLDQMEPIARGRVEPENAIARVVGMLGGGAPSTNGAAVDLPPGLASLPPDQATAIAADILGRASLPAPATVKLALDPDALPASDQQVIELYEVRSDVDLRLEGMPLKPDCELMLPAGKYALAWRGKDGVVEFRRFAVRSGESVDLTSKQY